MPAGPPPPALVLSAKVADAAPRRTAYVMTDVAVLVMGLFDRSAAVPAFGFFYPDGGPVTAANPLSSGAFTALQAAIGSQESVGSADKTQSRRYLLKSIANPQMITHTAALAKFPALSGTTPARAYNLFACALDQYDRVVGFEERGLVQADLTAGTASLSIRLDYGGLGALTLDATVSGSQANPLADLSSLVVGAFDAGSSPGLGWISSDSSNSTFDGTSTWFSALQAFLSAQGLANVDQTRRYCIREYPSVVAGGALATTVRNLPPGGNHRAFIMAIRNGATDVGHLISSPATVSAGATASIDFGAFTTD